MMEYEMYGPEPFLAGLGEAMRFIGIATAMFTMKGAMEDPEVIYLPVKSFASGLSGLAQLAVDVLTNTLTLPIDLVTPDEESGVRPKDMTPSPAPAVP